MSMPVFQGFRLVAGEGGIDRVVGTVSVMDAPDIYKWMKGGEFLITTGYVVKDCPEYIRSLIINLDKGGAAALGVKFDRFIHEFPEDALRAADELNFPIVSIPYEFAFTDVIDPVLGEVINRQSRRLLYSERIHEVFTRMVLEDEEIPAILAFLRQHIHRETAFIDSCFSKVYFAAGTEEDSMIYKDWNEWDVDAGAMPGESGNYDFYRMHINEHPAVHMTVEVLNNRPALETPQDSPFVRRMLEAAESVGISAKPKGLYFYTDASQMMSGRQLPFVIAGPGDDALCRVCGVYCNRICVLLWFDGS